MDEGVKVIDVLLVEDDPGDVLMTREAFADHKLQNVLHVVDNGADAMAFLRREGEYADAPRPDLVLLDLNLPRMDGREVLAAVKADEDLRSIPTVMLSSSDRPEDISGSYASAANSYVTKPASLTGLREGVQDLARYWIDVASLPGGQQ